MKVEERSRDNYFFSFFLILFLDKVIMLSTYSYMNSRTPASKTTSQYSLDNNKSETNSKYNFPT